MCADSVEQQGGSSSRGAIQQPANSPRDEIINYMRKHLGVGITSCLVVIYSCLQVLSPYEPPKDAILRFWDSLYDLFTDEVTAELRTYPLISKEYMAFSPVMFDASHSRYDEDKHTLVWEIHFLGEVETLNKPSFQYSFENPGFVLVKLKILEKDKPQAEPIEEDSYKFYVEKSIYKEHFSELDVSKMEPVKVIDNMIKDYNSAPILYQLDSDFHRYNKGRAYVSIDGEVIDPWYNFGIYRAKFFVLDKALLVSQMDIMKEQVTEALAEAPHDRLSYIQEYEQQWQCVLLAGQITLRDYEFSLKELMESIPDLCSGLKTKLESLKPKLENGSDESSDVPEQIEAENPIANLSKALIAEPTQKQPENPIQEGYVAKYLQISDIAITSFSKIVNNYQIYFTKHDEKSPPEFLFKKFGSVKTKNRAGVNIEWGKTYLVSDTKRTFWRSFPWIEFRNPKKEKLSHDLLWYPWGNLRFDTFLSCRPSKHSDKSADEQTLMSTTYSIVKNTQCHEWFDTRIRLQSGKHYCISADVKNILSIGSKNSKTKSITVKGVPFDTWKNRYSYLQKEDGSYLNVGHLIGMFKGDTEQQSQPNIFAIGEKMLYSPKGSGAKELSVNLNDTSFSDNFGEIFISAREIESIEDAQQCK